MENEPQVTPAAPAGNSNIFTPSWARVIGDNNGTKEAKCADAFEAVTDAFREVGRFN